MTPLTPEQADQLATYYTDEDREATRLRGAAPGTEDAAAAQRHEAHLGALRYILHILGYTVAYNPARARFELRPL